MKYGICTLSVVPVRKDTSDKSEMTTQLLFGDVVEFLDKSNQWLLVKIQYDGYEGWIDSKQITVLSEEEFSTISEGSFYTVKESSIILRRDTDNAIIHALMGSMLPCRDDNSFMAGGRVYSFLPAKEKDNNIENTALQFLHAPYLWGGKTIFGIDCSGLTQSVYKLNGIKLMRDAQQQAQQGEPVDFISETVAGDLAFFDNTKGQIIHTGIILKNNKIIHASGFVRIDTIDHQGIYNDEKQDYTHHLRLIKRFKNSTL